MTDEDAPTPEPRDRGFRNRKREDHALALIDELRASLSDLSMAKRILLELGRFYDPVLTGPIVDVSLQKEIVGALERGDRARALAIIDDRYERYVKDRAHLGREGQSE